MKITLTCNTSLGTGGQGVCLENAALGLNKLGDLTIFCSGLTVPKTDFTVYPVGNSPWSKRLLSTPILRRRNDWAVLLSDLYFDQQVSKKLKSYPCDLIMGVAGQTNLAFKAAKAQGAKAWLYCLNNYLPFMQQQIQQELDFLSDPTVATMNPQMLKRFAEECQQADLIIVLSEVAKQTFIQAGFAPEKIKVLTPFVDTQRFHQTVKNDQVFRVLYVGTIEPRKGLPYLVQAFLQADIPNSELLIVGGASTRGLRQFMTEVLNKHSNIKQEFWNFSQDDPTEVFGKSSVLVLPSVEDGFGLVALEAMACGLPAIVTSNCGAADVVNHGINGFISPPRDVQTMANQLRFLAENESIRRNMGKVARINSQQYNQALYQHQLKEIFLEQDLITPIFN
ncbi:glycosyltransferase family 4 protein [Sphaerospermopsis sp. LEGE 08334]|jgi:glycosyltransferase involved in cell wall biosynthesis|uniref:glycosyltransferase family 4 protein n=1 Tax=Sphaerospermopsis sp. LEGE 08334 TaxID=1828651 RepID=UPI0018810186|nr:glycosyltransferase family 4 protein [Sphaerospermopsis sp. LEGE 08334]MBE9057465.1 glycosyltransferase family 4 protein [Sphaerospermopsis sp. LEGE 08334]